MRFPLRSFATKNKSLSRGSMDGHLDSSDQPKATIPLSLSDCSNRNGFSVSVEGDSVHGRSSLASVIHYSSTYKKSSGTEQEEDHRLAVMSSELAGVDIAVRQSGPTLACDGYKSSSSSTQWRRNQDSSFMNTSSLFEPW